MALGSLLLGKWLVQAVYQSQAEDTADESRSAASCAGDKCFRLVHVLVALLQLLAAPAAAWLAIRSRLVYEVTLWGHSSEKVLLRPELIGATGADRDAAKDGTVSVNSVQLVA